MLKITDTFWCLALHKPLGGARSVRSSQIKPDQLAEQQLDPSPQFVDTAMLSTTHVFLFPAVDTDMDMEMDKVY